MTSWRENDHCVHCGVELDRGTAKVFTCCDECWDKKHLPRSARDGETLEAGYVAMNTDSLVALLRLLAEKQRQTKDAALLRACARRLHALYHADYSDD